MGVGGLIIAGMGAFGLGMVVGALLDGARVYFIIEEFKYDREYRLLSKEHTNKVVYESKTDAIKTLEHMRAECISREGYSKRVSQIETDIFAHEHFTIEGDLGNDLTKYQVVRMYKTKDGDRR